MNKRIKGQTHTLNIIEGVSAQPRPRKSILKDMDFDEEIQKIFELISVSNHLRRKELLARFGPSTNAKVTKLIGRHGSKGVIGNIITPDDMNEENWDKHRPITIIPDTTAYRNRIGFDHPVDLGIFDLAAEYIFNDMIKNGTEATFLDILDIYRKMDHELHRLDNIRFIGIEKYILYYYEKRFIEIYEDMGKKAPRNCRLRVVIGGKL